jgi:phosphoribosylaminoimidazolecarboxamide formyltransferase/IMP cyclohydrolase
MKRALISVSDKTGVVAFARGLEELGFEILSTGGTHKALSEAGIAVTRVSEATGFPEILDGRVKTLHPAIHGGILARRNEPVDLEVLAERGIAPIDLVAVNLYPFRETAARPGAAWDDLIENIDIGGPAMARSAAKNHRDVLVIVNPEDYGHVLESLRTGGCPMEERVRLAVAAFRHTADYDACVAETLAARGPGAANEPRPETIFPSLTTFAVEKVSDLRYGENPGQKAALYRRFGDSSRGLFIDSAQLQGKELSYNNWLDADSAFRAVQEFSEPAAVIVKHTNPCGAAVGETAEEAFGKACACDPVSAFGGIVAVNRPLSEELARKLRESFWEVIVAPAYSAEALETLGVKANLRLLEVREEARTRETDWKSVSGGFLVQERDTRDAPPESWKTVTRRAPSETELRDLVFAWKTVKHVKSNAIVVAKDGRTVGVGAGQMNRVGAADIALRQAGGKAKDAVMASDAFVPFPDTVLLAARHGIAAVVQPGGSLRDRESIEAADERGVVMLFTGVRHFRH